MTLTEEPQKLLELQQFYVRQVEQFYQQIQEWGKGKVEFTPLEDYPIYDKTGDYLSRRLTAQIPNQNADEWEIIVDFFPQGTTFLTEEGVIELQGPFSEAELVYVQKDKWADLGRNARLCHCMMVGTGFPRIRWVKLKYIRSLKPFVGNYCVNAPVPHRRNGHELI